MWWFELLLHDACDRDDPLWSDLNEVYELFWTCLPPSAGDSRSRREERVRVEAHHKQVAVG